MTAEVLDPGIAEEEGCRRQQDQNVELALHVPDRAVSGQTALELGDGSGEITLQDQHVTRQLGDPGPHVIVVVPLGKLLLLGEQPGRLLGLIQDEAR